MTLHLRQANLADARLLSELGDNIYRAHFTHLWNSELEMNHYLAGEYFLPVLEQSLQDHSVCWYVAETDRPMGFAKVTDESTIPDTDISGSLLNKLYFDAAETGKGYGQLMFETIKARARNTGAKFLWLEVLEQNERACHFYNKLGMEHIKSTLFTTASQQSVIRIMGLSL
ncbi:GNAT family N-acetyltransferase [Leclercia sp.]|uniref:GNAT family N-acetyltransferase n=1 Tax=Leclercia sp. TaxID=1898428 RepID=UPI002FDE7230